VPGSVAAVRRGGCACPGGSCTGTVFRVVSSPRRRIQGGHRWHLWRWASRTAPGRDASQRRTPRRSLATAIGLSTARASPSRRIRRSARGAGRGARGRQDPRVPDGSAARRARGRRGWRAATPDTTTRRNQTLTDMDTSRHRAAPAFVSDASGMDSDRARADARSSSGASVPRLDSAAFDQRAKARVPVPRRRLRGRGVRVLTGADRYGGIGLFTGRRGPRDAGGRAGDEVQAVVARWRRSPRRRRSRRAVREGRPQGGPCFVGERDVRGPLRVYGLCRCPCRRWLRGGVGGLLRRAAMSRSP
jgi:hypothetical protein